MFLRDAAWVGLLAAALALGLAGALTHSIACTPQSAPLRAPDVPYEPSPPEVVDEMLRLGKVGADDVVYDLGCGDGRVVIAAVKQRGARGVCVDIDPVRIGESRANARRAGVEHRITFLLRDLFDTELGDATVVMLFLWPEINLRLRPKLLRELAPGSRVVSHWHDMGDWKEESISTVTAKGRPRPIYRWTIPPAKF